MKKSELISGIILTLAGVAALIAALLTETSFDGIFWGIAGAGLCLGVGRVISWFHWSSPAQADRLKELQENKEIAQHDELNRIIMDRAHRLHHAHPYGAVCRRDRRKAFLYHPHSGRTADSPGRCRHCCRRTYPEKILTLTEKGADH